MRQTLYETEAINAERKRRIFSERLTMYFNQRSQNWLSS